MLCKVFNKIIILLGVKLHGVFSKSKGDIPANIKENKNEKSTQCTMGING